MLRTVRPRSRSLLNMTSSSSSKRVLCLGFISPRTATLLLAVFGLLAHVQQFNYLSLLHDTFPHVPKVRQPAAALLSSSVNSHDIAKGSSSHMLGANVVLDSEVGQASMNSTHSLSSWKDSAVVRPVRWFNLLPSKFQQSETSKAGSVNAMAGDAYIEQDWKARQRDQEEDRKSWEAARTLTKVVRLYALLCAVTCLCGIYGVVKSSLLGTRIFVLSSSLDLFLCAISLVSLGIIVTYPNIRGLICEELSSSSAVIMDMDQPSGQDLRSTTGPVLLLGRAATSFWKRAMSKAAEESSDSLPSAYWWDSLLDNLLENENCDDVLESVLIPVGLVISLIYLALRIHFLIVIRNYYISLLRDQMSYHLSSQAGLSHVSERKYSSSSTSSSASNSDFASCLSTSSKTARFDAKSINEKMA